MYTQHIHSLSDDMAYEIDLEKLVKEFKKLKSMDRSYEAIAFDNDETSWLKDTDLDSINDTLSKHDKIYLELGHFGYDDEYCEDEPYFAFGLVGVDEIIEDCDEDFKDSYYDKYKYFVAGYGIYVDSDLNTEYGYHTTEPPACGHGCGYDSYYDFKDARADDIIRDEIESRLDSRDIWK